MTAAGGAWRAYVREAGGRYWPKGAELLDRLDFPLIEATPTHRLAEIGLPDWARDLGIGSPPSLLVDSSCLREGEEEPHRRCDWWRGAFLFLSGAAEREYESAHGPTHSYSSRLRGVDARTFERAWVNRIFLFLRRWAAREIGGDEESLFGSLPSTEIELSHDVDAIRKTWALRLKRGAFDGFNALRFLAKGRFGRAPRKGADALRFALRSSEYWCFPQIRQMEEQRGKRSVFYFYAEDDGPRGPKRALFDPSYRVASEPLRSEIRDLLRGGWEIGLHPSFTSWRDSRAISRAKEILERAAGVPVTRCRQHWLRFSWKETWAAQEAAGLLRDSTLGFNDRPGFRNGCALRFHPWDFEAGRARRLEAIPLILMDSQLYDYRSMEESERLETMEGLLREVKAVRGTASVLWHQQTMHPEFGWARGYEQLLETLG